ncbi:MAG: RNA polymerase sigma factor [Thermoguttaceae bacterium]
MSMTIDSLAAAVGQARGGDAEAFGTIVRQYQSLVSGVLFSATGDFHQSEDLTQETFLIAWRKLDELRNHESIAAWLCTIARNLVNHAHRKPTILAQPTSEQNTESQSFLSPEASPDTEILRREQSDLVWAAIGDLDEKYRETLVLYYRTGQSVREIATAQHLTEEAVRQRLARARKSLKSKIEEMIGDVLTETTPGDAFTLSVVAAITGGMLVTTTQTVLAATSGATAATVGTTAGTSTAATGKVTGLAMFWATLGPAAYCLWVFSFAFIVHWIIVRNAPTLRARRYRVYSIFWGVQFFWIFYIVWGGVIIAAQVAFSRLASLAGFSIGVSPMTVLVPFMIVIMCVVLPFFARYHRRCKMIVENDLGLAEHPVASLTYTYREVERCFHRALIVNALLLETLLGVALILPLLDGSSGLVPVLGTLAVGAGLGLFLYGFYRFGLVLLELCRSHESLKTAPPLVDKPFETALGRSGVAPGAMNAKEKNRQRWLIAWFWCGITVGTVWYASLLDWSIQPVLTGVLTAALLIGMGLPWLLSRFVLSQRNRTLIASVFGFTDAAIALTLESVQCGGFSLVLFWQKVSAKGPDNMVHVVILMLALSFIGVGITSAFQWWRSGRRENLRKETDYIERMHAAIAHYKPEEQILDESPTPKTHPLPKRWVYGLGIYGAVVIVIFCIAALTVAP